MMNNENVWVVIPAFNAAETIVKAIGDLKGLPVDLDIVVVDDGSIDGTRTLVRDAGVHLVRCDVNWGYGAAVQQGVAYALKNGGQIFVTLGADNQRDVKDILRLLGTLQKGDLDIVIGSKFLSGQEKMPFFRKCGNMTLTWLFNIMFRKKFSDVSSGFKAFNLNVAHQLSGLAGDYCFDVDLCARIIQRQFKYSEIPVRVYYHKHSSKMRNQYAVGVSMLRTMLWQRFSRQHSQRSLN